MHFYKHALTFPPFIGIIPPVKYYRYLWRRFFGQLPKEAALIPFILCPELYVLYPEFSKVAMASFLGWLPQAARGARTLWTGLRGVAHGIERWIPGTRAYTVRRLVRQFEPWGAGMTEEAFLAAARGMKRPEFLQAVRTAEKARYGELARQVEGPLREVFALRAREPVVPPAKVSPTFRGTFLQAMKKQPMMFPLTMLSVTGPLGLGWGLRGIGRGTRRIIFEGGPAMVPPGMLGGF